MNDCELSGGHWSEVFLDRAEPCVRRAGHRRPVSLFRGLTDDASAVGAWLVACSLFLTWDRPTRLTLAPLSTRMWIPPPLEGRFATLLYTVYPANLAFFRRRGVCTRPSARCGGGAVPALERVSHERVVF